MAEPEAVALALAPAERRSSPAVMVTGNRLSEMSLMTPVKVPGSLASGPASVSTQLAVSDVILQSTSMVNASASVTWSPKVDGPSTNVIPGPKPQSLESVPSAQLMKYVVAPGATDMTDATMLSPSEP